MQPGHLVVLACLGKRGGNYDELDRRHDLIGSKGSDDKLRTAGHYTFSREAVALLTMYLGFMI